MDNENKITLEELEKAFNEVYLLADKGIIRITLATVIANRMFKDDKPVWLLILAGSSSGKTAILQTLDDIGDWVVPVDTLTTNAFASGLQRSDEVSLLHKANRGVLIFKDFTTITSMNEDGLREIMGQLRAIYDGSFDKKTGNNQDVKWFGKIGMIAGGTIAVQRKMRQFSEQGERFINYCMAVPESIEMTRRAVNNQKFMIKKEGELKAKVAQFINQIMSDPVYEDMEIPKEFEEEMILLSDFCTLARSPVILDKKTGKVSWVPEREMGPRMAIQLTNLGKALMIMSREKNLSLENAKILYQSALDSIPADRRVILRLLTKYKMASTKSMAIHLGFPTEPVLSWVSQLNARKMVDRIAKGDGTSDTWVLKEEYRDIISRFEKIEKGEIDLSPSAEEMEKFSVEQDSAIVEDDTLLNQIYGNEIDAEKDFENF